MKRSIVLLCFSICSIDWWTLCIMFCTNGYIIVSLCFSILRVLFPLVCFPLASFSDVSSKFVSHSSVSFLHPFESFSHTYIYIYTYTYTYRAVRPFRDVFRDGCDVSSDGDVTLKFSRILMTASL